MVDQFLLRVAAQKRAYGKWTQQPAPHLSALSSSRRPSAAEGKIVPRSSRTPPEPLLSECAVTRAKPVFGFCRALVLAVLQLGVRWRWVGPLLGQWPDLGAWDVVYDVGIWAL